MDHKEAFIVFVGDKGEETRRIESGMDKHVRFSGGNRPEVALQTTSETGNSPLISQIL